VLRDGGSDHIDDGEIVHAGVERVGLSPTETYDDGERLSKRHSEPYR
jgi:hypothetical protein